MNIHLRNKKKLRFAHTWFAFLGIYGCFEKMRLTVVAIIVDMFFDVLFGFWSTEHFALYACEISKILGNVDKPEKPFVANLIDFMTIVEQTSLLSCVVLLFASS